MFSPIRRSSLYFELVRFDIIEFLQLLITMSPVPRDMYEHTGHLLHWYAGSIAKARLWLQRRDMSISGSTLTTPDLKGAAMLGRTTPKSPEDCGNMTEVRAGVDAVDMELAKLLARRFAYMDAAARIKTDREAVRDEGRKAEVIENAVALASELGIPVSLISDFWEQLVEASIAYEFKRWDELNNAKR
jgi:isochorismate pyruvate lyase